MYYGDILNTECGVDCGTKRIGFVYKMFVNFYFVHGNDAIN